MDIKNIILDMGNVLLKYDREIVLDTYCKSDESKAMIRKEFFEGPEWILGDMGLIMPNERFIKVSERIEEKYLDELKLCSENWEICLSPVEGAKDFCKRAKENGFKLFVLSNASYEFYDYFPRDYDMDSFDGIVVSADLHIIKPNKEIYEHLLKEYSLKANECLFIDDMKENVEAARKLGINALVFKGSYDEINALLYHNIS